MARQNELHVLTLTKLLVVREWILSGDAETVHVIYQRALSQFSSKGWIEEQLKTLRCLVDLMCHNGNYMQALRYLDEEERMLAAVAKSDACGDWPIGPLGYRELLIQIRAADIRRRRNELLAS